MREVAYFWEHNAASKLLENAQVIGPLILRDQRAKVLKFNPLP